MPRKNVNTLYPFSIHVIPGASFVGPTENNFYVNQKPWMTRNTDFKFLHYPEEVVGNGLLFEAPENLVEDATEHPDQSSWLKLSEIQTSCQNFAASIVPSDYDGFVLVQWGGFDLHWNKWTNNGVSEKFDSWRELWYDDSTWNGMTSGTKESATTNILIPRFYELCEVLTYTLCSRIRAKAPSCRVAILGAGPSSLFDDFYSMNQYGYSYPTQSASVFDYRKANDYLKIRHGNTGLSVFDSQDYQVMDISFSRVFYTTTPTGSGGFSGDSSQQQGLGGGRSNPIPAQEAQPDTNPGPSSLIINPDKERYDATALYSYINTNFAEFSRFVGNTTQQNLPLFIACSDIFENVPSGFEYGNSFIFPFGLWSNTTGAHSDIVGITMSNRGIQIEELVKRSILNPLALDGLIWIHKGSNQPQSGTNWSYTLSANYFNVTYSSVMETVLSTNKYPVSTSDIASKRPLGLGVSTSTAGKIRLRWQAVENESQFDVYRSIGKSRVGNYEKLGTVVGTEFFDLDINRNIDGEDYWYKIVISREASSSSFNVFPFSTPVFLEAGSATLEDGASEDTLRRSRASNAKDLSAGSFKKNSEASSGKRQTDQPPKTGNFFLN